MARMSNSYLSIIIVFSLLILSNLKTPKELFIRDLELYSSFSQESGHISVLSGDVRFQRDFLSFIQTKYFSSSPALCLDLKVINMTNIGM